MFEYKTKSFNSANKSFNFPKYKTSNYKPSSFSFRFPNKKSNHQKHKHPKKKSFIAYEIKNETPANENDNFKLDVSNFSFSFKESSNTSNTRKIILANTDNHKKEIIKTYKENNKIFENDIISNELVIPENDICLSFFCTPKKLEKEISTDSQSSNNKTITIKEVNSIENDFENLNNKNFNYHIIENNKPNSQNDNYFNELKEKVTDSDNKNLLNKNKRKKNTHNNNILSTSIINNQKIKLSPIYFYSYPMIQKFNSNNNANPKKNYLINNNNIFFNQNNINNDNIHFNTNYNYFPIHKTKTEKLYKKNNKYTNNLFIDEKENTCILEINFKVSEKKIYKFKLRRFDNMFKEVLNFCIINNLNQKHAYNIIYLIIKSLNSIYSIYNLQLTNDEIKDIKGMKKYYDKNFL